MIQTAKQHSLVLILVFKREMMYSHYIETLPNFYSFVLFYYKDPSGKNKKNKREREKNITRLWKYNFILIKLHHIYYNITTSKDEKKNWLPHFLF